MAIVDRLIHYNLGLEKIDKAHASIAMSLDDLYTKLKTESVSPYDAKAELKKILHMYSAHCVDEDAMMIASNYPGVDRHIMTHSKIYLSFIRVMKQKTPSPYSVSDLLNEFITHVDIGDREFTPFVEKMLRTDPDAARWSTSHCTSLV